MGIKGAFKHDGGFPLDPGFLGTRQLDRTKLAMIPRNEVAHAANLSLFQLQDYRDDPEKIVMGATVLFVALCERCGLDPEETYNMGRRILHAPTEGDAPTGNALESLQEFITGRVMAKDVVIA